MRVARLTWLLVPICWALACGGRSERNGDEEPVGSGGSGGGGSRDLDACSEQRRLYDEFRAELIADRQTGPCETDADCMIFEDLAGCSPSCSYALPKFTKRGVADRLYAYAAEVCSPECPPPPQPPCPPPATPQCVTGLCR